MQNKKILDKNIIHTYVRGKLKYCVNITTPDKKRIKRYFDNIISARIWLKEYKKNIGKDLSDIASLSVAQITDIRNALCNLPKGKTLSQAVELLNRQNTVQYPLSDAIKDFNNIKEKANLSSVYISNFKTRLSALNENWGQPQMLWN